jgi:hypothetical protein
MDAETLWAVWKKGLHPMDNKGNPYKLQSVECNGRREGRKESRRDVDWLHVNLVHQSHLLCYI